MKTLLSKLKPLCFLLVIGFMVWGMYRLRGQLVDALQHANWSYIIAASFISVVYLYCNASVWGLVIRLVGHQPSRKKAAFLWIECEAMRWLPGGIWGYASRVVEAKRLGLNTTKSTLSLALELILTVLSWSILGIIGAVASPRLRSVSLLYLEKLQVPPTIVLISGGALLGLGMILFAFNILGLRHKFLSATGQLRQGLKHWKISVRILFEYIGLSIFYSLGFLFCLKGIGVDPVPTLLEACGSYALAWIVGFLAFGAPGGMGVREGFLFLVFAPLGIGPEVATAAILWRAIQILTELSLLAMIKWKRLVP